MADLSPVDRVVEALTARGCNPRQRGASWMANCPAHEDRSPSLSVSTSAETGNALVYCHAGCTTAEVAQALDLRMVDLFPPRPRSEVIPMGGIKAVYSYYDAEGTLAYQVVRKWPKTFRQRRPDDKGGWINNVDGVARVPYMLPQVLRAKAEGKTIWICEGEKDAENAQWYGVVGTCNSGGAGKWNDLCTEAVAGAAKVVIVADDDDAGQAHARQVATALTGKVAKLYVVRSDRGKDLSEHQAQGGTVEDLVTVWTSETPASDWLDSGPTEPERSPLLGLLIDWPEFWSADRTEEAWLAWPLIPEGRQVALFAPAKTGKSLLALDVAAAIATGRSVLGQPVTPRRRVLYLDYEMTEADLQERLFDLGYGPEDDLSWLFYASLPSLPPLDTADGARACCELAAVVEADLVIVDTLGRAVDGEENDNDTVRAFYRHTGLALKAAGRSLLRTDHAGKDIEKGQRGASSKNDDVDVVWRLVRMEGALQLKRTHSRVRWVPEVVMVIVEEEPLRHIVRRDVQEWPLGTWELAAELDRLDVALNIGRPKVRKILDEAGIEARTEVLAAALKYRRQAVDNPAKSCPRPLGTGQKGVSEDSAGDSGDTSALTSGDRSRDSSGQFGSPTGDSCPPLKGGSGPRAGSGQDEIDLEKPW